MINLYRLISFLSEQVAAREDEIIALRKRVQELEGQINGRTSD